MILKCVELLAVAVIAYLIGSIPTGYLIVKAKTGQDIRTVGSGSTGATNVKRVLGKNYFFLVMLLDAMKGALPVVLAKLFATVGVSLGLAPVIAAIAVTSLGKLNDTKAVPALIDVMKNRSENDLVRAGAAAALGVLRDQRALLPLRELIMEAEELGELEDTALKSFKKIMAANWQAIPGATQQKKPAGC